MSKLDIDSDILECLQGNDPIEQVQAIKALTKDLVLELIGEDTKVPAPVNDVFLARFYMASGRNEVKAELRKKVEEL